MNGKNGGSLWGMALISLAVVIAAVVLGGALQNLRRTGDTITVTGSARRPIVSDMIIWRGSVTGQRPTMQDAYTETRKYTEKLREFFRKHRIPENAITFSAIDTEPVQEFTETGRYTGRVLSYRITQRFEVQSKQVDSIETLISSAGDLISEGVPLTAMNPEYLYTKIGDLRIEMLGEATKDAKARAEMIATSSGSKIGDVRSARMGVFQVTRRNSTDVSDYGYYDTSSKEKDITAVVSVSFSLQ